MTQPAEPLESGMHDMVPPCDLDAEGLVLSHALAYGTTELTRLESRHFYADANARIFEAVKSCEERGEPIDVCAVARELRATGRLAQVGGSSYIATLFATIPATAYAQSHADAIRELWRRRVLIEAARKVVAELYEGELDTQSAWERLKSACFEAQNK